MIKIDTEILNKILANHIQKYIKSVTHHNQVEFTSGVQGQFKNQSEKKNQSVQFIITTN